MLRRPPEKEALPILGRRSPKDISWNIREGDLLIYKETSSYILGPMRRKACANGATSDNAPKKNPAHATFILFRRRLLP